MLEFILYFGLLSILVTAVTALSVEVAKSRTKAKVIAEVENNARMATARIIRAIRRADSLNVGPSTFNNDNGVLSLAMSGAAVNPTILDLAGAAIRIKEGAGATTALTSDEVVITKLRFSKDNLSGGQVTVTVELTAVYSSSSLDPTFNYTISTTGTAMIRKQGT